MEAFEFKRILYLYHAAVEMVYVVQVELGERLRATGPTDGDVAGDEASCGIGGFLALADDYLVVGTGREPVQSVQRTGRVPVTAGPARFRVPYPPPCPAPDFLAFLGVIPAHVAEDAAVAVAPAARPTRLRRRPAGGPRRTRPGPPRARPPR